MKAHVPHPNKGCIQGGATPASVWTGYLTFWLDLYGLCACILERAARVSSFICFIATTILESSSSSAVPTMDNFEENVKKLIKAKLEGREVAPMEKPGKVAAPTDLMAALKHSLAQMEGKKKVPQRAEAAQQASEVRPRKKPAKKAA